ncbi:hypothetical protein JKF63_05942 [Porcisia hertigi]|uniref:Uncharacterized protein n=1 Tax=Porcisia hertigi TaxID=2761500 RepID=A0A836IBK6_9TRYP|nr:hypothetical protein JKF63_05942 [Porcisia hertigi]
MGATPSREAKPTIRSLRYGNHEIGLIPITRAYFNGDNPQLRQQFIRLRNDPNVRYSHTRLRGYSMAELPPASYTEADLDALLDTVERSLFNTNEEMLDAGALQMPTISVAHLQYLLQCAGRVHAYDPSLEKELDESDKRSQPHTSVAHFSLGAVGTPSLPSRTGVSLSDPTNTPNIHFVREPKSWLHATSLSLCASLSDEADDHSFVHPTPTFSGTVSLNAAEAHLLLSPATPEEEAPSTDEKTAKTPSPEDCATDWFLKLRALLQAHHRRMDELGHVNGNSTRGEHGQLPCPPDFYKSEEYMRFKRAVRPVPCAVLFIYVNNREEHDCFTFQGHRVNVIGSFDMRSHSDEDDDCTPTLQIRKAILKAAGDRTLERVLALSTKYYLDSFIDIVLEQLQRRPAAELLVGLGEEARSLLLETPSGIPVGDSGSCQCMYDAVSIAKALFYERIAKLPVVVSSPFNNYPTLKFIYDFTSLMYSIENSQLIRPSDVRLCTYEREKDERGIFFLFHGRALAHSWLWATTLTQRSTVRDSWAQYTLCEHTQSRERRIQQWLATDPRAKTLFGDAATTACFEQHLEHLHGEIVRARSTPRDDKKSWSEAQEYSHDMKLYRIFLSPLCGPLLTTVKTAKPEKPKRRSNTKKQTIASSVPSAADGSNASTYSRTKAALDPRTTMTTSVSPHHSRSGCVQTRGKKSPNTPLTGLSTSEGTLSASNFSASVATMGGSSSSSIGPLYVGGMGQGTFLHQPLSTSPSFSGDGATRVAMPRNFMAPAALAGQGSSVAGMQRAIPMYFTDPQQQSQLQSQQVPLPPQSSSSSPHQQPGCFSPMMAAPPPAGIPFSVPSAQWPLHSFLHSPQTMATPPNQPSTETPMSYVVQVSSNGVQTLVPITFASTSTSTTTSRNLRADIPSPNNVSLQQVSQQQLLPQSFPSAMLMANGRGETLSLSSSQHSYGSKGTRYSGAPLLTGMTLQSSYPPHGFDGDAPAPCPTTLAAFATGHGSAPFSTFHHPSTQPQATAPGFASMQPAQLANKPAVFFTDPKNYVPVGYFTTSVPGSPQMHQ